MEAPVAAANQSAACCPLASVEQNSSLALRAQLQSLQVRLSVITLID